MRTALGTDFIFAQVHGTSAATPAVVIVLSTDTTTPASADSTYTGEINATSGGLNRTTGTYAHTTGTNTGTVTKTFTMNSNDGTSKVINKMYLTTSTTAGGGSPLWENLISNPPTLTPGDSVTITETLTYS